MAIYTPIRRVLFLLVILVSSCSPKPRFVIDSDWQPPDELNYRVDLIDFNQASGRFFMSGRVIDRDSLTPLAGASIFIVPNVTLDRGTLADSTGFFQLRPKGIVSLSDSVSFMAVGYSTKRAPIRTLLAEKER